MIVWAFDKILGPGPAMQTFSKFYVGLASETIIVVFGLIQLAVVLAFALGLYKTLSYGAVLLMHTVSVLASIPVYLEPLTRPNILFWAAIPVLAGIVALFILRDRDRLWMLGG